MPRIPSLLLLPWLAACAAGGTGRATPATFDEYLAEMEAEMEAGLTDLDASNREQLEDLFPVIASQVTWQGVLEVLGQRPAFLPLSRRMSRVIERRADQRIRREITTPFGNRSLRDLLVEEISDTLHPAAPEAGILAPSTSDVRAIVIGVTFGTNPSARPRFIAGARATSRTAT